jgi:hypothetical protein
MGLHSPSEYNQGSSRHGVVCRNRRHASAPPLRSLPLQRLPARRSGPSSRVCLARLPTSTGFRNLVTSSSAPCLPALFHAGSAHGVRPSELSSSHAAVHRFRCLGPPAVRSTPLAQQEWSLSCRKRLGYRASQEPDQATSRQSITRLQGFSPRESPPPEISVLDRKPARGSPGHSPLQGALPRRDSQKRPPLMRFTRWTRTTSSAPLQGLTPDGIGFPLSRSPTLLGFATS